MGLVSSLRCPHSSGQLGARMFQLGSARKSSARLDAQLFGHVQAWVLPLAVPNAVAEALLPPGFELAAQRWTPPGQHPLLLVAQRLTEVNLRVDAKALPRVPFVDLRYNEFALTIPYARRTIARPGLVLERLLAYTPLALVDHALPAVSGLLAGFSQQVRRCRMDEFGAEVRAMSGDALQLAIQVEPAGDWLPSSELMGARLLGEAMTLTQLGPSPTEGLQVSDWRLERSTAQLQAIRATVDLGELGLPGLPRGRHLVGPVQPGEVGGLAVRGNWHMGLPRGLSDVDLESERVSWSHAHRPADVVQELKSRGDRAKETASPLGFFSVWFLGHVQRVLADCDRGVYTDPRAIGRILGGLCDRYVDAVRTAEAGFRPSQPWQVALAAGQDGRLLSLQHLALALNAHWGLDLGIVVADNVRADYLPRFAADLDRFFDSGQAELAEVSARLQAASGPHSPLAQAEPWGPRATGPARLSLPDLRSGAWEAARQLAALSPEHRVGQLAALEWRVARRADQLECYSALSAAQQRQALQAESGRIPELLARAFG